MMMRIIQTAILALAVSLSASCAEPCGVTWTEGTVNRSTHRCVHTITVQNPPKGTDWKIWFCQFKGRLELMDGSQAEIRHISGTLHVLIPTQDTDGGDLTVRYRTSPLVNRGRAPEGFILDRSGRRHVELETSYEFLDEEPRHSFEYDRVACNPTDMIPQLKKVTRAQDDGTTEIDTGTEASIVPGHPAGWYRIVLDGRTHIEAADSDGAFWARMTLENIVRNAGGAAVGNVTIEDWPDLAHRALMLDVSRNFTSKKDLLRLIDILARYKANVLHLHLADDEGWRLEIDGLPELTSYGACREVPVLNPDGSVSEPDALMCAYCGTADRRDGSSSANGYYTRRDFVEILRYAAERHIRVIPEFDVPGHSRAAIKSMEHRFERTGDAACLLSERAGGSDYVSAQDYRNNVLDVALPSTYAFLDKVFGSVVATYAEAGVPLEVIHVGGDEVPSGAWDGSPSCRRLMEERGWTDARQLREYFLCRVMDIADAHGVRIAGWQEIAQGPSDAAKQKLRERMAYTNVWTVAKGREQLAYQYANDSIGVVVSIAPNAYLDFAYNRSKLERGHSWGGYVDERRSYSLLPYDIYKSVRWDDRGAQVELAHISDGKTALTPQGRTYIKGVQGQLWTETIRNFDHVTYYLFPKMLGILERGWNSSPEWEATTAADDPLFTDAFNRFYSVIETFEMPWYESLGISFHRN